MPIRNGSVPEIHLKGNMCTEIWLRVKTMQASPQLATKCKVPGKKTKPKEYALSYIKVSFIKQRS